MKTLAAIAAPGILGFGALASTDAEAQYGRYGGYHSGYGEYYGGYYPRPTYYYARPRTRIVVKKIITYPAYSPIMVAGIIDAGTTAGKQ